MDDRMPEWIVVGGPPAGPLVSATTEISLVYSRARTRSPVASLVDGQASAMLAELGAA